MEVLGWIGAALAAALVIRMVLNFLGSIVSSRIERRLRDTPLGRAVDTSVARAGKWDSSPSAQLRARAAYLDLAERCGVFLPLSRAEIERRADAFASGRVQVPAGPLLVQAAYLLTTQMSQEDIQRVVGSDREINDISSSMFIAVFGDFADALRRSKAGRNLDRLTLSFAFIFYLLHDRAVSEGLL